mmetsp:Transcript_18683/g.44296  ORF Transcript_18683/g.44296 Transcript_18683/m.44296 type:complete len:106 (-) Transcript_18683:441-758(-)
MHPQESPEDQAGKRTLSFLRLGIACAFSGHNLNLLLGLAFLSEITFLSLVFAIKTCIEVLMPGTLLLQQAVKRIGLFKVAQYRYSLFWLPLQQAKLQQEKANLDC